MPHVTERVAVLLGRSKKYVVQVWKKIICAPPPGNSTVRASRIPNTRNIRSMVQEFILEKRFTLY